MTGPERWVREGGNLSLQKSHRPDTYSFRISDAKGEVTIRFDIGTEDLRSLRRWIKEVLK